MPALTLALGISKLPTKLVAGCRKLCRPRCPAAGHASLGVSYAMTNQYPTSYSGVSWRGAKGGTTNCVRRHKDKEEDGTTFKASRADGAIKRTRCTARVKVSRS